jgi:hypothetical protein
MLFGEIFIFCSHRFVKVKKLGLLESGPPDPTIRDRSMGQHPIVEFLHWPLLPQNKMAMELLDFQTAKQITHRHGRLGCVPIHIGAGARWRKLNPCDKAGAGFGVAKRTVLQSAIDHNPVGAP